MPDRGRVVGYDSLKAGASNNNTMHGIQYLRLRINRIVVEDSHDQSWHKVCIYFVHKKDEVDQEIHFIHMRE
jgi:hypothetical protein